MNNLAFALEKAQRWTEALTNYEASLKMFQHLSKGDHPDVATTLNNIAGCLNNLGRPTDALLRYQETLTMLKRLASAEPGNIATKLDLAGTYQKLGNLLTKMGKIADGTENYRKSLDLVESLGPGEGSAAEVTKLRSNLRAKLDLDKSEARVISQ